MKETGKKPFKSTYNVYKNKKKILNVFFLSLKHRNCYPFILNSLKH